MTQIGDMQSIGTAGWWGVTVTYPSEDDVRLGVVFGGGIYTGNLVLPAVGDVELAVNYGASGTEFTGTFVVPTEAQVQLAVSYGASGTEFTGTFVGVGQLFEIDITVPVISVEIS